MSQAKDFGNVVNKPLLTGGDGKLIRDIFHIPELHILTGIVGKELERKAFNVPQEGKDFMNALHGLRRKV